jgi:DNA-binding response OmpR family regulator
MRTSLFDNRQASAGTGVAPEQPVAYKILIVDDNDAARTGLALLFERAGYEVLAVGTYTDGRAALTRMHPDLLIADVRLGEYNGLQLLTTLTRPTAAIIITGHPDPVIEADAHRMGADFLVKPVPPATLIGLVERKLTERTPTFKVTRRWERKPVSGNLPARVGNTPARVLDISYGGLRLEMEREPGPVRPESLTLDLPDRGLSVVIDVAWTSHVDDRWMCGGSVIASESAAWQGLVDAVA